MVYQALLAMKKNTNDGANVSSAIIVNGAKSKWSYNSLPTSVAWSADSLCKQFGPRSGLPF